MAEYNLQQLNEMYVDVLREIGKMFQSLSYFQSKKLVL